MGYPVPMLFKNWGFSKIIPGSKYFLWSTFSFIMIYNILITFSHITRSCFRKSKKQVNTQASITISSDIMLFSDMIGVKNYNGNSGPWDLKLRAVFVISLTSLCIWHHHWIHCFGIHSRDPQWQFAMNCTHNQWPPLVGIKVNTLWNKFSEMRATVFSHYTSFSGRKIMWRHCYRVNIKFIEGLGTI